MNKLPYKKSGASLLFFLKKHPCPQCGRRMTLCQTTVLMGIMASPHDLTDEELERFRKATAMKRYRTLGYQCKKCDKEYSILFMNK